jgi:pyruvate,water dikinase
MAPSYSKFSSISHHCKHAPLIVFGWGPRAISQRLEVMTTKTATLVRWFEDLYSDDTNSVGGKNASLGEMLSELSDRGVRVPGGFATTADAYWQFLDHNELRDRIREQVDEFHNGAELQEVGERIRGLIREAEFPEELTREIREAYQQLVGRTGEKEAPVAIRSSATAEDLPEASFAGQQETCLNVRGEDDVLARCEDCFASLFTDRAIAYRQENEFDHLKVALSAGVQQMVAADCGAAGVMFSIHTESGFPDEVVINAAWGLGQTVVGGEVNPDEYLVFKPLLGESEQNDIVPILARQRGGKEKKAVYAKEGRGELDRVDTSEEERQALLLSEEDILPIGAVGGDDRGALRSADGHRVGPRRPDRRALHPPGPTRNRPVAEGCGLAEIIRAQGALGETGGGAGYRKRHRGGHGARAEEPG